jgi:hypothetical protein
MSDLSFLSAALFLLVIIAFVIWGNLPSKKSATRNQTHKALSTSAGADQKDLGFVTGISGGDLADAAKANYALSRLRQEHGREPTPYEIGLVVGLAQTIEPPDLSSR